MTEGARCPEPFYYKHHEEGDVLYEGYHFPPRRGEDLSLRKLYCQEDVTKHPDLAERLSQMALRCDVRTLYAPSVASMNARIVKYTDLTTAISLPKGVVLYRNKGLPADGTSLPPRAAFVMSNAGCPAIAVTAQGCAIVAHAGRDSLIDRGRLRGESPREFEGVLHAIAYRFTEILGISPGNLRVITLFSIRAADFTHPFDHPEWGDQNRLMFEDIRARWGEGIMTEGDGKLSIPALIRAQALSLRLAHCTSKCSPPAASQFASTRSLHPEFAGDARNIALICRRH